MVMKSTLKPCLHNRALIAVDLLLDLVEEAVPELSDVPIEEHPAPPGCVCVGALLINSPWATLPSLHTYKLPQSRLPKGAQLSPLEMRRMQLLSDLTVSLSEN